MNPDATHNAEKGGYELRIERISAPVKEKSTLEILELIKKEIDPKPSIDIRELRAFKIYNGLREVNFAATPKQAKDIQEFANIEVDTINYSAGKMLYKMHIDDYKRIYETSSAFKNYYDRRVTPIIRLINSYPEDFSYLLNRHEPPLFTVYTIIQDSKKYNDGNITRAVEQASIEVLDLFILSCEEKLEDILKLKEEMELATVSGHVERLKAEADYIKDFIRGDGMKYE